MVSFFGSPTYQLSKHLPSILKHLIDESRHKLQSTDNIIDAIKTVQIPDDHKLVSFDVESLFTSTLLQFALPCAKTAINKSPYQPPLPTYDLIDLDSGILKLHLYICCISILTSSTLCVLRKIKRSNSCAAFINYLTLCAASVPYRSMTLLRRAFALSALFLATFEFLLIFHISKVQCWNPVLLGPILSKGT